MKFDTIMLSLGLYSNNFNDPLTSHGDDQIKIVQLCPVLWFVTK